MASRCAPLAYRLTLRRLAAAFMTAAQIRALWDRDATAAGRAAVSHYRRTLVAMTWAHHPAAPSVERALAAELAAVTAETGRR